METHVTHFLKHPQVYKRKLAEFLMDKCGVELWPATEDEHDDDDEEEEEEEEQEGDDQQQQEVEVEESRSDLNWWEGGRVGGRVGVRGTHTSFPRRAPGGDAVLPLWTSRLRGRSRL
jgi:hypothetical protein